MFVCIHIEDTNDNCAVVLNRGLGDSLGGWQA